MLGIESFRFRKFRNQKRDAQTDLQRSELVADAVAKALSSIDVEMIGLKRRVEEIRAWVGGLIDSDTNAGDQRSPSAEKDLIDAEKQLVIGVKRLEKLVEIRTAYHNLQAAIDFERSRALASAHPES